MLGGQAAPPTAMRLNVDKRRLCFCMCSSTPSHTVGTPAENVTFSDSNSSYNDFPSSAGPGKTSFAPFSGAEYGNPHALTWNIGTTGKMVSLAETHIASGSAEAKA